MRLKLWFVTAGLDGCVALSVALIALNFRSYSRVHLLVISGPHARLFLVSGAGSALAGFVVDDDDQEGWERPGVHYDSQPWMGLPEQVPFASYLLGWALIWGDNEIRQAHVGRFLVAMSRPEMDRKFVAAAAPHWAWAIVLGLAPSLILPRSRRRLIRRKRESRGFCRRCGYDLRASPDRCPECGQPVSPAAAKRLESPAA